MAGAAAPRGLGLASRGLLLLAASMVLPAGSCKDNVGTNTTG